MCSEELKFNILLSDADISKGLKLPTEMTPDLAYALGVLAGDGNILVREHKKDYRVKCVGNPKDEKEFYHDVLKPLFYGLFGINIDVRYQDSNKTYGFYIYSKALVRYLTELCELPEGKKSGRLKIPSIIKSHNLTYSFIKGVADTDFCVSFKKGGKYPTIVGSSDTKGFIEDISLELQKIGLKVYQLYDYKIYDPRFINGFSIINRLELNGRSNLNIWMRYIGFNSPKHLLKIKNSGEWTSRRTHMRVFNI